MAEKRYSIVRSDMRCPYGLEETFCSKDCHKCRLGYGYYGETKNQLIKKVATAILRTLKDGEVLKYEEFGKGFIKQPVSVEYLAESIVEFMGVN